MGNETGRKVAQAFIEGRKITLGNYQSTGHSFLLFGNTIAENKEENGFYIRDAGHCSATTSTALNALPGVRLRRLKGEWIRDEKEKWNGKDKYIEYKF